MRVLLLLLVIACIASANANALVRVLLEKYSGEVSQSPTNGPRSEPEVKVSKCATENKVTKQIINEMAKNKKFFSLTEETKGFPTCLAKSFGLMNEDGSLTKAFVDDPNNAKCINLGGKGQSEIAVKVIECIAV